MLKGNQNAQGFFSKMCFFKLESKFNEFLETYYSAISKIIYSKLFFFSFLKFRLKIMDSLRGLTKFI